MAKKKTAYVDTAWENNHEKYPLKRGVCEFCGQRDDLKLSFDNVRYICVNDHACFLRWKKNREV